MRRLLISILIAFTISVPAFGQVMVAVRVGQSKARKSPNSQSAVVATLHRGDTVLVTDDLPYWYKITLKDGRPAFVPKSSCTVIGADDLENETPPDLPTPTVPSGSINISGCTASTIPADWSICPAIGSGGIYAQAYKQKNRLSVPCSYTPMSVDDVVALQGLPHAVRSLPDSDPRSQYLKQMEGNAVRVEGFLAMAKDGGDEGVNCGNSHRLDTHMELVNTDQVDPQTNRPQHIVTEITPWFRGAIPAWTTQGLGDFASYLGGYTAPHQSRAPTKVRIYGYLFFDEAHAGNAGSWRGSAWEIHPITRIEIFENGDFVEFK